MLNNLQIILLVIVSLMGIPAGFLVAHYTKEELKPGKRWFKIIAAISLVCAPLSFFLIVGDNKALALSASAFIFFIALAPLIKIKQNGKH